MRGCRRYQDGSINEGVGSNKLRGRLIMPGIKNQANGRKRGYESGDENGKAAKSEKHLDAQGLNFNL